jgi:hypothetical protein
MLFWAVVSAQQRKPSSSSPLAKAEAIVQAWNRDEPEQAGALRVEKITFETSPN